MRSSSPIRIPTTKELQRADRPKLIEFFRSSRELYNEWIRKQVLEYDRIDILAVEVLGLEMKPFHVAMAQHQLRNKESMVLAARGLGKTSVCTECKVIHLLLKDPNLRILISSKTLLNATGFLKNIKGHFEKNEKLAEIFGPYYDPKRIEKWEEKEIVVLPRTKKKKIAKEASVTCIGAEGTVVSRHFDVHIIDDLIDEDNTRTKTQRDKIRTWYYNTLDPTLEPPDSSIPHRGERHIAGTRYHYDDLYGHLIKNEMKDSHLIIPALDSKGRSPWPEKFSPEFYAEKRRRSGLIIFGAQFQCATDAMLGEIFKYELCQQVSEQEWPDKDSLKIYMGIDLSISEKEKADKFAIVVIGVNKDRTSTYVLDYYEGILRFVDQTKKILQYYDKWKPIRAVIETNQYQAAQYQKLKSDRPDLRLTGIHQHKDKITRAWKLSGLFEDKKVFFRRGEQDLLIEHMVLFPNHTNDDLFDAFDNAVRASKSRGRMPSDRTEPGLI